jgi:hypothetical protein
MKTLYAFSSSHGDVIVDDATLARPFIVRPFQNHPFMTLGDYFLVIRDLILRDDGQSLTTLLCRLWKRNVAMAEVDTITIRYEKYGTLYHISSAEIVTGAQRMRLTVSAAVTDESKEALDREFDLLQRLSARAGLPYLPQVYCKHKVQIRTSEGSETLLMTLSEWFENYHEWHFSRDEAGRERTIVWDMESGYRFMSEQETCEIISQAATILTSYYDTKTYHRIFPWHHGAGDFVVKTASGAVDVRLVTARGYEPIALQEQNPEIDPVRALILFFLETILKMRLDKYEGMGESTWADASAVEAATDGFFRALRIRESEGDGLTVKVDQLIKQMKGLSEDELRILLHSRMGHYRSHDPSDYTVVMKHVDDHARDVFHAMQTLPG